MIQINSDLQEEQEMKYILGLVFVTPTIAMPYLHWRDKTMWGKLISDLTEIDGGPSS